MYTVHSQLLSSADGLFVSLSTTATDSSSSPADTFVDLVLSLRRLAGRNDCSVTAAVASKSTYGRSLATRDRKYSCVTMPALPMPDSGCKHQTSICRHQTPPPYCNAAHGSHFTVQPSRFSIRPITVKRDVINKTRST